MLSAYVCDRIAKQGWATVAFPWTKGEVALVVGRIEDVDAARKAHPGLADYLLEELDILEPLRFDLKSMRDIYCIKKILGGRVRGLRSPRA